MKNRAKCKLCKSIIESFYDGDYVSCKCGEISVSGGSKLECSAKDWNNFLRVDDQGNEIIVTIKDDIKPFDISHKPNKKELLNMLEEMIKSYERLPEHAMLSPVTQSDLVASLLLLLSILRCDCNNLN